jgi:hypothetical protein
MNVGGDLRVPPRGRTHRCAPTFRLYTFDRNSVLNPPLQRRAGVMAVGNGLS